MKNFDIDNYERCEPQPAVEAPNSVPTGSRFETSSENYCTGLPYIPVPDWLVEATEKYHNEQ